MAFGVLAIFRLTDKPTAIGCRIINNTTSPKQAERSEKMTVALDKKRFGPWALVTGASSGIGKEFAQQIAASGINIVLVARREDLLKEVGVEFSKRYGVEHRVVVLDVSREDFIRQLASATDDLDVGLVVSNAGSGNPGEFLKLDRQLLEETLRLNTMSHLDIAHYFGGKLAERSRGGLILVRAMGAENGIPCMANDGAAKAYVHSLGEALHYELKPLRCLRHCTGSRGYEHSGARKVRPRSEDYADETDERRALRIRGHQRSGKKPLQNRPRPAQPHIDRPRPRFSCAEDAGGHVWYSACEQARKREGP